MITDLVMPRMGGVELFRTDRARGDTTRFLFTSGYIDDPVRSEVDADPDLVFLPKPWTVAELVASVGGDDRGGASPHRLTPAPAPATMARIDGIVPTVPSRSQWRREAVPDPELPFLGIHVHRTVDWGAEAGPNAVLATHPEGNRRRDLSPAMLLELAAWPGFWPMGLRHGRHALGEMLRSLSPRRFLAALRRAWPSGRRSPGGW